jgi:hypothetical protein
VSAAVIADAGRGARLIMTARQADPTVLTSEIPDIGHLRLDEDVAIDPSGLACIMRGISVVEDESGSPVSAFNSSI